MQNETKVRKIDSVIELISFLLESKLPHGVEMSNQTREAGGVSGKIPYSISNNNHMVKGKPSVDLSVRGGDLREWEII